MGNRKDNGAVVVAVVIGLALAGCASDPKIEMRPVGAAVKPAPGSGELELAGGALAIGNVGLALEQYRQGLRAHPDSLAALRGIASCYDEMGRADLARRYYEEALAIAPADLGLLRQYAASLAHHGAVEEAQAVIAEIALRTRAPAAQWVVDTPRAAPAATGGPSPAVEAASSMVRKVRLERLSLGEIALVTTAAPLWKALPVAPETRTVRLLNAARRQGLAARNRAQLAEAGWRRVTIGDAPSVRPSSLILYPEGKRGEARQLGERLRIAALRQEARADILVLLGRDRG